MTALETGRHHRSPSAPSLPQLAQNAKVEKELQVGPDLRRTVSSRGPGVPRDCPDGAGRLDRDQNDSITTQPAIRQSLAHQLVPSQNPLHRSKSARPSPQTGATRPVPGKVTHWQVTKPSANSPPSASPRSAPFALNTCTASIPAGKELHQPQIEAPGRRSAPRPTSWSGPQTWRSPW